MLASVAESHTRVETALEVVGRMTSSRSTGDIVDLLLESLRPFGVSTYALWATVNPERIDPVRSMLSNWPSEWIDIYLTDRKYLCDPVVEEAARHPGSFFWRDIEITPSAAVQDLFQRARQYGIMDGFTSSSRAQWPVVTALSLSGRELAWDELEEGTVSLISNTFMARMMYIRSEAVIPAVKALSYQERSILRLAAGGLQDKEIARELRIGPSSQSTYWERLREKLGAHDRAQAVAIGLWSGQITLL